MGIIEKKSEITDFINQFVSQKAYDCKKLAFDDKDIKCDIIIDNLGGCPKGAESLVYMLNSDENPPAGIDSPSFVISYGLNSLATVTASSISDDGNCLCFQYCLQREIINLAGSKIEPQEFPVRLGKGISIHSALACVTFALLCGKNAQLLF